MKKTLLCALFLIMCTIVQAQDLTVQGKVISKTDGEPIIGATVVDRIRQQMGPSPILTVILY